MSMRKKCRNTDQRKTPYFDTFHVILRMAKKLLYKYYELRIAPEIPPKKTLIDEFTYWITYLTYT